ncbi:MAG: hypothetical protein BRD30_07510 [Bacteroidetes bacterium QH_2_63_10]|nr:MAG: hypothetical protein BRD30_07510 [Bacteroidetes bacterium QH_2_63_10]
MPYGLPQSGKVALRVYSIEGRKVQTLVDGRVRKGHHEVVWRGHNKHGRKVASGIYLYVLETESTQVTKKMSLLR